MRFSIFTHAEHKIYKGDIYAYAPYVREMNFWISHFEEVVILGPKSQKEIDEIDLRYEHKKIRLQPLAFLHFKNIRYTLKSITDSVLVISRIFSEMYRTDHIHIRCPGNIGLLASFVQIFFPSKPKTVKYAGNWDPESKQPLSYKIQKWILSSTFLSRNTKVLIYGNWNNLNNNHIPFFTASYSEKEKIQVKKKFDSPYKFLFVGSLVDGKRPLLSLKIVHGLIKKGIDARLDIYGRGRCEKDLAEYIVKNDLQGCVGLHGNQDSAIIKEAYKTSHFSLLPSKSEGWPKALAEAMFFGCVPISTRISCTPWMLANGKRGILIEPSEGLATKEITNYLEGEDQLDAMSHEASSWSQEYTLEKFRDEIRKLL